MYRLVHQRTTAIHCPGSSPSACIIIRLVTIPFYGESTQNQLAQSTGFQRFLCFTNDRIVSVLENRLNGKFSCGTMIESSVLPLIWSNAENKWIEDDTLDHVLAPKALYGYETYLNGLQKASDKAPSHFVYSWNAPSSMEENSLSCSYVYTYYYLLRYKTLSSFVVDFDEGMTKEAFSNLVQILRYIDTEKGTSITEPLLSYFKEKRWEDVLKIQTLSVPDVRNVYRVPSNAQNPSGFTGSFEYFDFSLQLKSERKTVFLTFAIKALSLSF
jgi:hypothetical protein